MLLLSEVLGRPVLDTNQRSVGRLCDLVVRLEPAPNVLRLRVGRGKTDADIAWRSVSAFDESEIRLAAGAAPSAPQLADDELLLKRHVLDAQIIDVAGKSLTRSDLMGMRVLKAAGTVAAVATVALVALAVGALGIFSLMG